MRIKRRTFIQYAPRTLSGLSYKASGINLFAGCRSRWKLEVASSRVACPIKQEKPSVIVSTLGLPPTNHPALRGSASNLALVLYLCIPSLFFFTSRQNILLCSLSSFLFIAEHLSLNGRHTPTPPCHDILHRQPEAPSDGIEAALMPTPEAVGLKSLREIATKSTTTMLRNLSGSVNVQQSLTIGSHRRLATEKRTASSTKRKTASRSQCHLDRVEQLLATMKSHLVILTKELWFQCHATVAETGRLKSISTSETDMLLLRLLVLNS